MPKVVDYSFIRDGLWRLVVLPDSWTSELQEQVMMLVQAQSRSRHPQTVALETNGHDGKKSLFLKVFHGSPGVGALKDIGRASKALRFWRQGLALSAAGFNVPLAIAAGERRRLRLLDRAFVITSEVDGQPMPIFLANLANAADRQKAWKLKRAGVGRLAALVRQFHRQGFVHGDLLASNLLVSQPDADEPTIYFMDNDRTRRYPFWFRNSLWKRNLVQLNRMPLPGITLQDRVRFLQSYLGRSDLVGTDRQFARWLEKRTRGRRKDCDGVDATGDFRKLMRWE